MYYLNLIIKKLQTQTRELSKKKTNGLYSSKILRSQKTKFVGTYPDKKEMKEDLINTPDDPRLDGLSTRIL